MASYPVITSADYWANIKAALPAERGPDGRPSFADYELVEHPQIVNVFAERFDQLPQFIVGRSDYREHNYFGRLTYLIVVRAQLRQDGIVELLEAIVDDDWPEYDH